MIKTVKITGHAYNQDGSPASQAIGRAVLSTYEIDSGVVIPNKVDFKLDENGYFEIALWPNQRGQTGSHYSVKIYSRAATFPVFEAKVVVPDVDYEVDILSIIDAPPYPPVDEAQQAVLAAKQHAEVAKFRADEASESASVATNQANQATQSATEAATSASQAADIVSDVGDTLDAVTALRDETEGFRDNASISANSASLSALAAATSESNAADSATTATTKATEASTSASEASSSASAASSSADEAASRATESMGYKEAAEAAAQEAADNAASVDASVIPLPNRVPKSKDDGLLDDGWMNLAPLRVQVLNALYPDGIYPSLDLRFAGADRINNPNVSFSRASKATYWDADGVLCVADIDETRFDYDPLTGEALGLLVEGQVTNNFPDGLFMTRVSDDPALITTVEDEKLPGVQVTRIKGVADDYEGFRNYRTASQVRGSEAGAGPRRVALLVKPSGSVRYMRVATWLDTHPIAHAYTTSVDLWNLQVNKETDQYSDFYLQDVGDGWVFVSFTASRNTSYLWISVAFGMDGQGATNYGNWTPLPEGDEVLLALPQHYSNTTRHVKTLIPTYETPVTRSSDIVTLPTSSFDYHIDRGTLVVTSATPEGELVAKLGDVEIYSDSDEVKEYRATYSTTNNATELELGVGTFKSIQYYNRVLP